MIRIKICGITNLEDAQAACEAGADALGFVFAPEARARHRYIEPEAARTIIAELPPFVSTVAVCVNDSEERLRAYLEFVDYVQLQGEESPELFRRLGSRAIKAFRTGPDFVPSKMLDYPSAAYVLDAYVPGTHGGTGHVSDWALARQAVALGRPIILAGGLTPENVAEAVRVVRPYGVDVSGGVQKSPGKKDHERIRAFIDQARLRVSG
ncbi:MAG TPA: phosphoribosylanthranilate isomerase [Candidatus Hydrogenedentes bacterium]|nr:phosphoribosylanthranilate isomerase [Candidatus Hydrogenedentota bacterium]HPG66661.1 phosphoribosylanthranilate isomerase [Candidatus Hydrogenedentota bacterium]